MTKKEIKAQHYYETNTGTIVRCDDLGEGRFPRTPKFTVMFPFKGQIRIMEPREIRRELSEREVAAFTPIT